MNKEQIQQVLTLIDVGLALVEKLLPTLSSLKLSGEITAEQQQAVLDKFNSLRAKADGQFGGPEWEVTSSDETPVESPPQEGQ